MPESIVDKWRVFVDKYGLVEDKPVNDTNLKKFLDDVARQQEPKKVARSGAKTGKVCASRLVIESNDEPRYSALKLCTVC